MKTWDNWLKYDHTWSELQHKRMQHTMWVSLVDKCLFKWAHPSYYTNLYIRTWKKKKKRKKWINSDHVWSSLILFKKSTKSNSDHLLSYVVLSFNFANSDQVWSSLILFFILRKVQLWSSLVFSYQVWSFHLILQTLILSDQVWSSLILFFPFALSPTLIISDPFLSSMIPSFNFTNSDQVWSSLILFFILR